MSLLRPEDLDAIALSLKVAAIATILSLPVATGYALLVLFGRQGVIGETLAKVGIVLSFNWAGAALAAAVMAFPLVVSPIRLAIEAIDREVDEVATTLGAGRAQRFFRVILPLASPGVLAGAVLGFAKALGEFGATITFVGAIPGVTLTLPSAIHAATQVPGAEPRALALCAIAAALAVAAVLGADLVSRWAARRVA